MGAQNGANPNEDWVDRWSRRLAEGIKHCWPPIRNWVGPRSQLLLRRWGELSRNTKRVAIGIGCGVLIAGYFVVHARSNSEVQVNGNDIELVYYTTSNPVLGDDVTWALNESRNIAQIVWRTANQYPKQKGIIRVAVRHGGEYRISNDAPAETSRRPDAKFGDPICLIKDDLLRTRKFTNGDTFTYESYKEYSIEFLYLPFRYPRLRLHWE